MGASRDVLPVLTALRLTVTQRVLRTSLSLFSLSCEFGLPLLHFSQHRPFTLLDPDTGAQTRSPHSLTTHPACIVHAPPISDFPFRQNHTHTPAPPSFARSLFSSPPRLSAHCTTIASFLFSLSFLFCYMAASLLAFSSHCLFSHIPPFLPIFLILAKRSKKETRG